MSEPFETIRSKMERCGACLCLARTYGSADMREILDFSDPTIQPSKKGMLATSTANGRHRTTGVPGNDVSCAYSAIGAPYTNNQGALSKYRVCSYNRISGCRQALSAYIRVLTGSAILSAANHSLWLNGSSVSDFAELAAVDGWQHVNAIVDHEPRYASHQVTEILPLFAAIGDEVLLALPAILPDAVRVGPDDGIIPSLTVAG